MRWHAMRGEGPRTAERSRVYGMYKGCAPDHTSGPLKETTEQSSEPGKRKTMVSLVLDASAP